MLGCVIGLDAHAQVPVAERIGGAPGATQGLGTIPEGQAQAVVATILMSGYRSSKLCIK